MSGKHRVFVALLALCAVGFGSAGANPVVNLVVVRNSTYHPGDDGGPLELHVTEGEPLSIVNTDSDTHSVTETDPPGGIPRFDSGLVSRLEGPQPVVGVEDLDSGSYPFYCTRHAEMSGVLHVDPTA